MRKESLNQRAARSNMPVGLRVTLTLETRALIEGLAKQLGITTEQAVAEAISDWRVRREESANRKTRLGVETALRAAQDRRSVDSIIADFKQQMDATGEPKPKDFARGLTGDGGSAKLMAMTLVPIRERREKLGLTRQKLATLAECSLTSIQMLEGGYRAKESAVQQRVEDALADAERAQMEAA